MESSASSPAGQIGPASTEIRALASGRDGRASGAHCSMPGTVRSAGVQQVWLVTTNDNLAALALYQKAGWRLTAIRAGALDESVAR